MFSLSTWVVTRRNTTSAFLFIFAFCSYPSRTVSLRTPGPHFPLIVIVWMCPCLNVRWSSEYLCCVVLGFVPRVFCPMITGPVSYHCALVYLFEVLLALLFGFQPSVFYAGLYGLRHRAFTWHAVIWVKFKKLLRIPAPVSRSLYSNVTGPLEVVLVCYTII